MARGNAAAYFVERHLTEGRGDKVAFIQGERSLTYTELSGRSACMAALYERHGLRREDRAAMIVLDVIEFPIIFWGSLAAGVIAVPINTLLTTDAYHQILLDSRARALFVSAALLDRVRPLLDQLPELRAVFVVDGDAEASPGGEHLDFTAELAKSEPRRMVGASPEETAFWLYSSGSTGAPKGVRHVHASLQATHDTYGARVLGIEEDDVVFSVAKLFFAYGLGNGMTFPMAVGATTALLPSRPTPETVLAVIERVEPTIFYAVPTFFAALLAHLGEAPLPGASRLRRTVSAGEALPAEIGERWRAKTGVDILDGVGSTEMLHIFLSNRPGDVVYGTSGTAVPGYEVRLVDETGTDVDTDQVGELLVNGDTASEGYWNKLSKSRETFIGRWTRTGDKYVCRDDGRYVYCGRTDDMFKVGGVWVSPFEVEQALIAHPAVLEAAVVPMQDSDGLTKPKAFVVPKERHDDPSLDAELKEHVKQAVGAWKYPRSVELREELPKTATGKIQRFKLREQ